MHKDGSMDKRVIGSLAECVKARKDDGTGWARLKEIFSAPSLKMVSFTITEKGYNLRKTDGSYLEYVQRDIENGPDECSGAIAVVTGMQEVSRLHCHQWITVPTTVLYLEVR